ncbi:ATP-binding protein [soil metagenome]
MPRRRAFTVSVRVRILASILIVTAAGMAVAGGTAFLAQRELVLNRVDTRLTDTAARLRTIAKATDYPTVRDLLTVAIQQITPDSNEGILGIIDGTATIVPGSQVGVDLGREAALVTRVNRETAKNVVVLGTYVSTRGSLRYIAVPVSATADGSTGTYVAAYSLDAELAPIGQASRTYTLVGLGALLLIALVGWFVAGRLLRPIRMLRGAAERITESDLSERLPVAGNDDVSELTATVNDMLDRLEQAIVGQRQLLDDVGHELKTPLTIVRGHLEVLDGSDPADVAATRELAIDELDRMNGLVADISMLASVQRGTPDDTRPTDIRELTETVFRKASAFAGNDWRLVGAAEVVATIDADRVTQAWLQLASNASRYATPNTVIEIGSTLAGPMVRLFVRDAGPGIPAEAHERIFERFSRGTTPSEPGRGDGGSGLGLAIVARIAESQGGTVDLDSALGRGSTFTLVLPVARAAAIEGKNA